MKKTNETDKLRKEISRLKIALRQSKTPSIEIVPVVTEGDKRLLRDVMDKCNEVIQRQNALGASANALVNAYTVLHEFSEKLNEIEKKQPDFLWLQRTMQKMSRIA